MTPRLVVGAALLDDAGRVLAACRAAPAELAGRWEFPGGKVEPGETEDAALVRECREELAVAIEIGERIGPDVPLPGGRLLRVWIATVSEGEPVAVEHAELRWLAPADLYEVDWLPGDRPVVDALHALSR